jgi:uncharacterized membrane protein
VTAGQPPASGGAAGAVDSGLRGLSAWLTRHWLALVTVVVGIFVALPIAAPFLAMAGFERVATVIYVVYRITCHQLPQRSWFVGGQQPTYTWAELQPYVEHPDANPLLAFHHPLGNETLGYQVAFCERETAIYLTVFLTCLAYGFLRRRREFRAMPIRLYVLFLVPMAIDGLTQLFGWRESTPLLRTVTGAIFGLGSAWLVLTYIEASFREATAFAAARAQPDGSPAA